MICWKTTLVRSFMIKLTLLMSTFFLFHMREILRVLKWLLLMLQNVLGILKIQHRVTAVLRLIMTERILLFIILLKMIIVYYTVLSFLLCFTPSIRTRLLMMHMMMMMLWRHMLCQSLQELRMHYTFLSRLECYFENALIQLMKGWGHPHLADLVIIEGPLEGRPGHEFSIRSYVYMGSIWIMSHSVLVGRCIPV